MTLLQLLIHYVPSSYSDIDISHRDIYWCDEIRKFSLKLSLTKSTVLQLNQLTCFPRLFAKSHELLIITDMTICKTIAEYIHCGYSFVLISFQLSFLSCIMLLYQHENHLY